MVVRLVVKRKNIMDYYMEDDDDKILKVYFIDMGVVWWFNELNFKILVCF